MIDLADAPRTSPSPIGAVAQPARHGSRWTVDVLALGLLALTMALTFALGPWSSDVANDFGRYSVDGHAFLHGLLPYRDLFFEYPPLAAPLLAAPALSGGSIWSYDHTLAVEMFVWAAVLALTLRRIATRTNADPWLASIGVVLVPVLVGAVARSRFDLAPVALTTVAVLLMLRSRPRWGFAVLACAVLMKGFPILAAPVALAWVARRHGRRAAWAGLGVFLIVIAAVMGGASLLSLHGVITSIRFQVGRPVQLESSPASLLWLLSKLGLVSAPRVVFEHREFALVGPQSSLLAILVAVGGIGIVAALTAGTWRAPSGSRLIRAVAAALATYAAFTSAFSPQYILWTVPLFATALMQRRWRLTAALALAMVITLEEYAHFSFVVAGSGTWMAALVLRNALVCIAVAMVAVEGVGWRPRRLGRLFAEQAALDVAPDSDDHAFDLNAFVAEESTYRPTARQIPAVLGRAIALTHRSAPRQLITIVFVTVVSAGLTALQVVVAKAALGEVILASRGHRLDAAAMLPFVYAALITALTAVLGIWAGQAQRMLSECVQRDTMRRVLDVATSVDLEAYESPGFSNRLQRVLVNSLSRPVTVTHGVIGLIRAAVSVIGLTAVMLVLAPLLVPVLALVAIPLSITNRRSSRLEMRFSASQASDTRKRFYFQEVLIGRPGAKEVRAFGLGDVLTQRWDALWGTYLSALTAHLKRQTLLALVGRVGASLCGLGALLLLLHLVQTHQVSLAAAGAAGLSLLMLSARVEGLSHGTSGLYESALFLSDLERFLSLTGLPSHGKRSGPTATAFQELTTESLSFTYPSSTEPAISDVDFTIRRGEVVAIVGENGSGKTTLAKVLADLYRPTAGRVLWDGRDTAALSANSVRDQTAIIFQDFVAYAMSAAENIAVGRAEAMDDRDGIVAAARRSGADRFLEQLPQGYDSYLSAIFEGGRDLSLGQWQRIALARAFFRNAPFIILDEPSSALDARAEHDLFARIRTLLEGRTVLLISHRFSSVRSADRIYVMKDGRIAEHGSHDALMDLGGIYAELYTLQADAYLASAD